MVDAIRFMLLLLVLIADTNPRKRGRPKKEVATLKDRYPALVNQEQSLGEKEAFEALRKEMSNNKPRKDIFLPLMKSTFSLRRHYVLHDAQSVVEILQEYPALKHSHVVSYRLACMLRAC